MRENKFRAWDKTNKRMIYLHQKDIFDFRKNGGFLVAFVEDDYKYGKYTRSKLEAYDFVENTGNFIIMQYTGLKDKNGIEIYEGDIIKSQFLRKNGVIEYVDDKVCFMVKISMNEWHFISDLYDLKIIGNVYKNPELLREKKWEKIFI